MTTTVNVRNFSGDKRLSFYLSIETLSFDFDLMTRDCRVILYAESDAESALLVSQGALGSVTVLGKTVVLPQSVTVNDSENTIFCDFTVTDVSDEVYGSSAPCTVTLNYSSDVFSLEQGSTFHSVDMGKMITQPTVTPQSVRSMLGTKLILSGEVFREGYSVGAAIEIDNATYYAHNLEQSGNGFFSREYWLNEAGPVNEFTSTVTISASYNGVALPSTYSFDVTYYLSPESGYPEADIVCGFQSDEAVIQELGICVKNHSRFTLRAQNISIFYGASLESCCVYVDGVKYDGAEIVSDLLTESGTHFYRAVITDTRGRSVTYTGEFSVLDYALPDFSATVKRTDAEGGESLSGSNISLRVEAGALYPLGGINTVSYTVLLSSSGAGFEEVQTVLPDVDYLIDASLAQGVSYTLKLRAEDTLGACTEKLYTLDCERIELSIAKNKVGVGKKGENERAFECGWDIHAYGDVVLKGGTDIGLRAFIDELRQRLPLSYVYSEITTQTELDQILEHYSDPQSFSGCVILMLKCAQGLSESGVSIRFCYSDGQSVTEKKL